jgi:hypothetical protein
MPRQPLPNARGCIAVIHSPNGETVISDNPAPLANNKGLRCIGLLILQGITPQPIVEQEISAIEIAAFMIFREQNGGRI